MSREVQIGGGAGEKDVQREINRTNSETCDLKSDTTEQLRPVRVAITVPAIAEKGARDGEEEERAATIKRIDLLTFSLEA